MRRNSRKGTLWVALGLLLIAAALFLGAFNLYDERRAGQSAMLAADRLEEAIHMQMSPDSIKVQILPHM